LFDHGWLCSTIVSHGWLCLTIVDNDWHVWIWFSVVDYSWIATFLMVMLHCKVHEVLTKIHEGLTMVNYGCPCSTMVNNGWPSMIMLTMDEHGWL